MDRDRPAAVRTDDDALAAAKAVTSEGMALFQQGRFAEAVARGEEGACGPPLRRLQARCAN